MVKRTVVLVALAVAAVSLVGCVATVRGRGGVVYAAPPAVRVEAPPPAPYAGATWVGGHWFWNGYDYEWRPGYYVQARPGYQYVAPTYVRRGGGYYYVQGGWRRGGGAVYVGPRRGVYVQPRGRVYVQPRGRVYVAPRARGTIYVR
ncbi:MAG: hypothetical protein IT379_10590 [Deltaproteobacteria bacterium]|nr:hypothetical protein [Deltaproteobacteria bacterium]